MRIRGFLSSIKQLVTQTIYVRIIFVWIALFCLANARLNAGEMIDTRINIGLKLFRAILSADLNIKSKSNSDAELPLLLIYKDNIKKGNTHTQNLLALGKKNGRAQIKSIPVKVTSVSYQSFLNRQFDKPAGIFLLDKLSMDEIRPISSYGINKQLIVYSPFDGDVEKNITAGLSIAARVRPVINVKIMNASNIQIKTFFLKVAKKYEP
jgi:hypothetical protein